MNRDVIAGRCQALGLHDDRLGILVAQQNIRNSCHSRNSDPVYPLIVYPFNGEHALNKQTLFAFFTEHGRTGTRRPHANGGKIWAFPEPG